MKRIRIVEIVESTVGGVREHLRQIITHIDRERFDLTIICSTLRDPTYEHELEGYCTDGIPTIRVPMVRNIRPIKDLRAYRQIQWELRVRPYDVVHTHGSKAGVLGRFAKHRHNGALVVHTGHTFPLQWAETPKRQLYTAVEKRAARWSNRIIALSKAQKQTLLDAGICEPEKIVVIPNGVDVGPPPDARMRSRLRDELGIPQDALVVGMVGRIVRQKNPMLFLKTIREIRRHNPQVHAVWVGAGEQRAKLENAASEAGILGQGLIVTGFRDDARLMYPAFDLFLMTSRWEGMPYAVLEAMAAGLPVVSVDVPGMNELIVDGTTGYLAQSDAVTLAERSLVLLNDAARREIFGAAAQQRTRERHSVKEFISKLEDIYESAVHHRERAEAQQRYQPV